MTKKERIDERKKEGKGDGNRGSIGEFHPSIDVCYLNCFIVYFFRKLKNLEQRNRHKRIKCWRFFKAFQNHKYTAARERQRDNISNDIQSKYYKVENIVSF